MKFIFISIFTLFSAQAFAQNLSTEEQRILLEDVKMLKDKVQKLEGEKSGSSGGGLKTTDYHSQTTSVSAVPAAEATPAISPEQMQELMKTLNHAKSQNDEKNKILKELDEDEE